MATFVSGDLETVDQLLYGNSSRLPAEYLERQHQQFIDNGMSGSMDFFQSAWDFEAKIRQSRMVQAAKAATRKVRSIWQSDEVRRLLTVGELQHAPLTMQRFIMAEPETRNMWQNQMCDGYGDTCEFDRDASTEQLVEYRQVLNGIVIDSEDEGTEYEWEAINYFDDETLTEDQILSVDDQFDILATWSVQKRLLILGDEDFTSPQNERLEEVLEG